MAAKDTTMIETLLRRADFSRETGLKNILREKISNTADRSDTHSSKITSFRRLSEDDLILINAAQGLLMNEPGKAPDSDK